MTFSLSGFINGFTNSEKINKVLLSPIWLAVIITLILIIILYFSLRSHVDENFISLLAKISVYVFLASTGVMFLHDQSMKQKFEQDITDRRKDEIVESGLPELSELRNRARPDISPEVSVGAAEQSVPPPIIQQPVYTPPLPPSSPPPEPVMTFPQSSNDGTIPPDYFT